MAVVHRRCFLLLRTRTSPLKSFLLSFGFDRVRCDCKPVDRSRCGSCADADGEETGAGPRMTRLTEVTWGGTVLKQVHVVVGQLYSCSCSKFAPAHSAAGRP